jgi:hypothetical protein
MKNFLEFFRIMKLKIINFQIYAFAYKEDKKQIELLELIELTQFPIFKEISKNLMFIFPIHLISLYSHQFEVY